MTLIIAAANSESAILASDRRLTLPEGRVLDEETCKLTAFACKDAKVMIAYTGNASTGTSSTGDWIIDALTQACEGADPSIYEVLDIIKDIANAQHVQFCTALGAPFKLELIVVGYFFSENVAQPKIWRISNSGNAANFSVAYGAGGVAAVELGGSVGGVSTAEVGKIRSLLLQNRPTHGIEMKLVSVIKKASESNKSCGTIGKQINSCCLSSALNAPFIATYHSNFAQNVMYSVNSVLAVSKGGVFVSKDGTLTAGSENPPVSIPSVAPSQLCPCGSGMKYKHCHARIKYPYLPLFQEEELNDYSLDSGTLFTVRSYGAYGAG